MCDCLTVVKQFNAILQNPLACTGDHADVDHPNHKKRDKYLRDGITTLQFT